MKFRILWTVVLVIGSISWAGTAQAQKKKGDSDLAKTELKEMYQNMYEQGLKFNDLSIATSASHALAALDPENTALLDTLAKLYFERSAFPQCALVSAEILKSRPEDLEILELAALSKQALGLPKQALADYEKLYSLKSDLYYLYEIAMLQYTMRRFGECEESIGRLLADPKSEDQSIVLSFNKRKQNVPLTAACHNLYGVLQLDQGNKEKARLHLQQAIQIYPDFLLAKGNLESMDKK